MEPINATSPSESHANKPEEKSFFAREVTVAELENMLKIFGILLLMIAPIIIIVGCYCHKKRDQEGPPGRGPRGQGEEARGAAVPERDIRQVGRSEGRDRWNGLQANVRTEHEKRLTKLEGNSSGKQSSYSTVEFIMST